MQEGCGEEQQQRAEIGLAACPKPSAGAEETQDLRKAEQAGSGKQQPEASAKQDDLGKPGTCAAVLPRPHVPGNDGAAACGKHGGNADGNIADRGDDIDRRERVRTDQL